jgi:hypothetical protein
MLLLIPAALQAQIRAQPWAVTVSSGRVYPKYSWVNDNFVNLYGMPSWGNNLLGHHTNVDDVRFERRLNKYFSVGVEAERVLTSEVNEVPCYIIYKNDQLPRELSGMITGGFLGGLVLGRLNLNPFLCGDSSFFGRRFRLSLIGGVGAGDVKLERVYGYGELQGDSFQLVTNATDAHYHGMAYPLKGACNFDFIMTGGK